MKNSVVSDVMTDRVLRARPAMPLKEVARVLAEHRISAMPVLDPDDRVIGVVSERDLLPKQAASASRPRRWWRRRRTREDTRRAAGETVGHVMTVEAVTVGPDASLAEAAKRMIEHEVKHLPVVDAAGVLVGIVGRGDLIRVFLRTDDELRETILTDVFMRILRTDPTELAVSVTEGIVTLSGTVEQRSTAEMAEQLVRRLDGVVDVVSALGYRVDDRGISGRRARPSHTSQTSTQSTERSRRTP